eukprot:4906992-Pyramimonas_sp.AAC.1
MFDKTCETIPSCAVRVTRERLCVCPSSGSRPLRRVFPVRVCYRRVPPCPCVLCARADHLSQCKSPASLP